MQVHAPIYCHAQHLPPGHLVVLEECLGSGDLDSRSLNKCQGTRLLDLDCHTLVTKVHGDNASNVGCQGFDSLECGLIHLL